MRDTQTTEPFVMEPTRPPAASRLGRIGGSAVAVLLFALLVLAACSQSPATKPTAPSPASAAASPVASVLSTGSPLMGARLFAVACSACHGARGQGNTFTVDGRSIEVPALGWPDLSTMYRTDPSRGTVKQQLEEAIMFGEDEEGQPFATVMPRWRVTLTQAQVDSIIAYIKSGYRSEGSSGNEPMGAQLFQMTCANCHGRNGQGNNLTADFQTIHVPTLSWSELTPMYQTDPSRGTVEQQVKLAIEDGLDEEGGPLAPMMPHWKTTLSNAQVDSLLSYIRAGMGYVPPATGDPQATSAQSG